ncbi:hypothetical protein G6F68_015957 [Rhizopus microsporus]|nr:hypothetical protein G6F68_015957 [Rhizopus microsporus]
MPPYDLNDIGLEFPEYLHGPSPSPSPIHSLKSSTIPTLIPVPDAGPTVVLATANNDVMNKNSKKATSEVEEVWISSPDSVNETINPSNLVMSKNKEKKPATINEEDEEDEEKEPKDLYLSTTTLTVGTWHRLRMNETDLVCVYRPDTRTFAWHIVDGGCHFKMEVTQDAPKFILI